jgi:hypothetical protein
MVKGTANRLRDIAPAVQRQILPLIFEAAATCIHSHALDEFNDEYTFGTAFWRHVHNRIRELARSSGSTLRLPPKLSSAYFILDDCVIRYHRVDPSKQLPRLTSAACQQGVQLSLFDEYPTVSVDLDTLVIGTEIDPIDGIREVFLGILEFDASTKAHQWHDRVTIYAAGDPDFDGINQTSPAPEPDITPTVRLDLPDEEAQAGEMNA